MLRIQQVYREQPKTGDCISIDINVSVTRRECCLNSCTMTAAAGRAFNGFKRKCRDLKVEVDTFSIQLDNVTTGEAAQQINYHISNEQGKLLSSYDELEKQYPEIREDKDPVPTKREVLYGDLRQLYVDAKVKAVNKIAELRIQAVPDPVVVPQPEPAQVASSVKAKR